MKKSIVVILLEAFGACLVAAAGFLVVPALGFALLGVGCVLFAVALDRTS